jgi:hypothetical protein
MCLQRTRARVCRALWGPGSDPSKSVPTQVGTNYAEWPGLREADQEPTSAGGGHPSLASEQQYLFLNHRGSKPLLVGQYVVMIQADMGQPLVSVEVRARACGRAWTMSRASVCGGRGRRAALMPRHAHTTRTHTHTRTHAHTHTHPHTRTHARTHARMHTHTHTHAHTPTCDALCLPTHTRAPLHATRRSTRRAA